MKSMNFFKKFLKTFQGVPPRQNETLLTINVQDADDQVSMLKIFLIFFTYWSVCPWHAFQPNLMPVGKTMSPPQSEVHFKFSNIRQAFALLAQTKGVRVWDCQRQTLQLMMNISKLRFVPGKPFQPSLIFGRKTGAEVPFN